MTTVSKTASRSPAERWFWRGVGAAAIGGLVVRVANAWTLPKTRFVTDATYYHVQANLLAKGHGFADPFIWQTTGRVTPSAFHPPLFSLILSIASLFGGTSLLAHRIVTSVIGLITIVAVAVIARELAGSAVGITAAILVATYPTLWGLEGSLMSESLAAALVAVALIVAIRLANRPSIRTAVLLGVVSALASLTHPETLLLVPFLALPVIATRRALTTRRKIALGTVVVVTATIVLAPWLVRNLTGFSRPVLFSTNGDEVLGVANCPPTYHTPAFLGYWFIGCVGQPYDFADEAKSTSADRRRGLHYMRRHLDRFLGTVMWARLGRVADVYRPFENARYSASEGRRENVAIAGVFMYWACLPFALVGGIVLWRRSRTAVLILLAPCLVVVVTAIYAFGAERFRAIAEPTVIVLTAVGVLACWQQVRRVRGARSLSLDEAPSSESIVGH
jgi:4-amino-4-deoxy-L-arabinose transferase-like glycosyltransferase